MYYTSTSPITYYIPKNVKTKNCIYMHAYKKYRASPLTNKKKSNSVRRRKKNIEQTENLPPPPPIKNQMVRPLVNSK
jgi:hypothetical protein